MMMETILKVDGINVYYGSIHAIKGISFEVNKGEIVTLIGANGAGKSTTLNTVAGLLRPRSGVITFDGKNLAAIPAHKTTFGKQIFLISSCRKQHGIPGIIHLLQAVLPGHTSFKHIFFQNYLPEFLIIVLTDINDFFK